MYYAIYLLPNIVHEGHELSGVHDGGEDVEGGRQVVLRLEVAHPQLRSGKLPLSKYDKNFINKSQTVVV